jgi:hypothetical protein
MLWICVWSAMLKSDVSLVLCGDDDLLPRLTCDDGWERHGTLDVKDLRIEEGPAPGMGRYIGNGLSVCPLVNC